MTKPLSAALHVGRNSCIRFADLAFERNRASILSFDFMWGVAMPCIAATTVLPGFLDHLGLSKFWIGLVPAVNTGLGALAQPLSVFLIKPGHRRFHKMLLAYVVGSLGYILLGLLILSSLITPALALVATILAVLMFSVGAAFGDPHFFDYVVATITPEQRGRYFGLRSVLFSVGGIAGGAVSALLLNSLAAPANFGASIMAGGVLFVVSTLCLIFYRRQPEDEVCRDSTNLLGFLTNELWPWLHRQDFRLFLISIALFALAACGYPFLALLLKARLGASDQLYGLLGGLSMGSCLVVSWLLGQICDRWGARPGVAFAIILYCAGVLGCLFLHERVALLTSYMLASVWIPAQMVSIPDLALRLAPDAPPNVISALKVTVLALPQLFGPLLIGVALDHLSFLPVLLCCVACGLASLALLARCRVTADQ